MEEAQIGAAGSDAAVLRLNTQLGVAYSNGLLPGAPSERQFDENLPTEYASITEKIIPHQQSLAYRMLLIGVLGNSR